MRPDWDTYFMGLAWLIKERSTDPNTKHGSVIVNHKNQIIGTGYNAHPTGTNLSEKYFHRPNKYKCMIHAEQNAILNMSSKNYVQTVYVTGKSCLNCLISIIQIGAENLVQLNRIGTALESDEDEELYNELIKQSNLNIRWVSISCLDKFNQVFSTEELKKIQNSI